MRTVKKGDRYDGKPGEVITLVLPQDIHIVVVLVDPIELGTICPRCPLFGVPGGCDDYLLGRICCSPLEDAVE